MAAQMVEDAGQQGDVAGIADTQAKTPLRCGGDELWLPGGQPAQRFQHLAARPYQLIGAGGRGHAARRTHEQRVVQLLAQARQPDADGRLALP